MRSHADWTLQAVPNDSWFCNALHNTMHVTPSTCQHDCACLGRFYSSMLQRSGKTHRKHGGGSLTLMGVIPGVPTAGQPKPRAAAVAQYTTLSPAQKAKLLAALEQQQSSAGPTAAAVSAFEPGVMPTEVCLLIALHHFRT